jgi:hypothetical protein
MSHIYIEIKQKYGVRAKYTILIDNKVLLEPYGQPEFMCPYIKDGQAMGLGLFEFANYEFIRLLKHE